LSGALRQPDVFHNNSERRGARERSISSEKGRIGKTRSGYVKGVVRAHIVAVLPSLPDKRSMWNTVNRPSHKIFNREESALLSELAA
jgi:hypothetical protein